MERSLAGVEHTLECRVHDLVGDFKIEEEINNPSRSTDPALVLVFVTFQGWDQDRDWEERFRHAKTMGQASNFLNK
jgi:hypothetical protein